MAIINNFPVTSDPNTPCYYIGSAGLSAFVWGGDDIEVNYFFVCYNTQVSAYDTPNFYNRNSAVIHENGSMKGTYYIKILSAASTTTYSINFGGVLQTNGRGTGYSCYSSRLTVGDIYKVVFQTSPSSKSLVYGPDGTLLGEYAFITGRPKNIATITTH